MAHAFRPGIVETRHVGVKVDCGEELGRGRTNCDLRGRVGWEPNAHVAVGHRRRRVHLAAGRAHLLARLSCRARVGVPARRSRAHGAEEASRQVRPKTPSRVKKRTRRKARRHPSHQHPELIGLGLLAFGLFMATVLYVGWNGGYVGKAIGDGLVAAGRRDRVRAAGRLRRRRRADGRAAATCRGSRPFRTGLVGRRLRRSRSCSGPPTADTSGDGLEDAPRQADRLDRDTDPRRVPAPAPACCWSAAPPPAHSCAAPATRCAARRARPAYAPAPRPSRAGRRRSPSRAALGRAAGRRGRGVPGRRRAGAAARPRRRTDPEPEPEPPTPAQTSLFDVDRARRRRLHAPRSRACPAPLEGAPATSRPSRTARVAGTARRRRSANFGVDATIVGEIAGPARHALRAPARARGRRCRRSRR